VPANVFTLDKADEQTFLKDWQDDAAFMKQATRIHSDSASPCTRRKPHLFELRGLGVDRCFPGRIHEPGFPSETLRLSVVSDCISTPVPEGRGARHLRRIAANPSTSSCRLQMTASGTTSRLARV
jgi:hypothetical protein